MFKKGDLFFKIMDFDIEEHVNSVIQVRKGREQAGHIWLYGFHYLVENQILSYYKIEEYIAKKLAEHPLFTKFKSSVQMFKLMEACLRNSFSKGPVSMDKIPLFSDRDNKEISGLLEKMKQKSSELDFLHVHLPVNDSYHLEFPLLKKGEFCEFIYTSCERCRDLEEHGFPEIFLRKSVDLGDNAPNMYDNRISVNHQNRETMIDSYKAIENFVDATRINV